MIDAGDLHRIAPIPSRQVVHLPDRQCFFKHFGLSQRPLERQVSRRAALIDRQSQEAARHVSQTFSTRGCLA